MKFTGIACGLVALLALGGCDSAMPGEKAALKSAEGGVPATAPAPMDFSRGMGGMGGGMGGMGGRVLAIPNGVAPEEGAPPAADVSKGGGEDKAPPTSVPRKIVYTADLTITVEKLEKAEAEVVKRIHEAGGYLADSDLSGNPGSNRSGMWKARIPVDKFESFVDSIVKLGELQKRSTNSQDVTEEFYDLETRIANKKVEEGRLVKHLQESTGKLKEILDVEREISRVREEAERMEGRLRLLANQSALTTVTIHVYERVGYVPETEPTFGTMILRRFTGSADKLIRFCRNRILDVVSIVPWLPVWAVVLGVAWLIWKRLRVYLHARSSARSRLRDP